MRGTPIVKVISMCHKPHAEVWKLTSDLMPNFLQADEFIVYVPDDEVSFFLEITNPKIRILSQSALGIGYKERLLNAIDATGNSVRFGWYLQQFYKIEALLKHSVDADILVILDADCIPLRKIPLVDDASRILYLNLSTEFHKPYFECIDRLLGLKRVQNRTFITHPFPIRNAWIIELVQFIEARHGCSWADAIIKTTDFSLLSGFSEIETLGTWIANSYPDAWASVSGKWERLGQSRFGQIENFDPEKLVKLGEKYGLDLVVFEHWDNRTLVNSIKRLADKFLGLSKRT